jgi:hypothetical protein
VRDIAAIPLHKFTTTNGGKSVEVRGHLNIRNAIISSNSSSDDSSTDDDDDANIKSMKLLPSKIRYSKDTIGSRFYNDVEIGETLDNICDGNMAIDDLPAIHVAKKGHLWYTADNRSLWMFTWM